MRGRTEKANCERHTHRKGDAAACTLSVTFHMKICI